MVNRSRTARVRRGDGGDLTVSEHETDSPIIPVATCPAASGAARRAVRASSWRIEGRETGFAEALMRVRLRAGMAPTGNGPLSYVGQQDPR